MVWELKLFSFGIQVEVAWMRQDGATHKQASSFGKVLLAISHRNWVVKTFTELEVCRLGQQPFGQMFEIGITFNNLS